MAHSRRPLTPMDDPLKKRELTKVILEELAKIISMLKVILEEIEKGTA